MIKEDDDTEKKISEREVIRLMRDLISIPSPYFEEEKIITFVHNWFQDNEIEARVHKYSDDKVTNFNGRNIVSVIEGKEKGTTVCLNGHLDTVRLSNGWSADPFGGEIKDGMIYGVGALDMKSGCCAIMLALRKFVRENSEFKGKIITTLVSDEEGPYGLGTNAVIEDGLLEDVDFSIVAEPSACFSGKGFPNLCLGARGGYGLEVEFFGKSAHAALPSDGKSAAIDAAKVVCALENVDYIEDPFLGRGTVCVLAVESDGGACSVPDYAKIKLFWHIVVGENEDTITEEIKKAIVRAGIQCDYKISFREAPSEGSRGFMPYIVEKENPYVEAFIQSVEAVCGASPTVSYFQSIGDFNYLGSRIGAPVVIFGADGRRFHSDDECADINSIVKTAGTIYDFLVKTLV
ncbi:MAG TPA: M20/M25/M40 family metallo-hydrolase [Anaerovoracaceae bacterium]|nr:M20/M25/M40 family metallo-hydrolase [Anaerovoracaceae bacterium]